MGMDSVLGLLCAVTAVGAYVWVLWDGDERPPLLPYIIRLAALVAICATLAVAFRASGALGLVAALCFMVGGAVGYHSGWWNGIAWIRSGRALAVRGRPASRADADSSGIE